MIQFCIISIITKLHPLGKKLTEREHICFWKKKPGVNTDPCCTPHLSLAVNQNSLADFCSPIQTRPKQCQVYQRHFLEPQAIYSGQRYRRLRSDRWERETLPVSYPQPSQCRHGHKQWPFQHHDKVYKLVYFSCIIIEIMSAVLFTNSTFNQCGDEGQLAHWSQYLKHWRSSNSIRVPSGCWNAWI